MNYGARKIRVTIDPMGNPKVEAEGFAGVGCADATAPIEQALAGGAGGVERVFKPEYHATDDQQEHVHQGW